MPQHSLCQYMQKRESFSLTDTVLHCSYKQRGGQRRRLQFYCNCYFCWWSKCKWTHLDKITFTKQPAPAAEEKGCGQSPYASSWLWRVVFQMLSKVLKIPAAAQFCWIFLLVDRRLHSSLIIQRALYQICYKTAVLGLDTCQGLG